MDLIDRQAAIDAVYKCDDIFAGDMPSADAVEVVRCKDCKHLEYGYCEKLEMRPEDKFFCGYGERKDE